MVPSISGCNFKSLIFKCFWLVGNVAISGEIIIMGMPQVYIYDNPSTVQVMICVATWSHMLTSSQLDPEGTNSMEFNQLVFHFF